MGEEGIVRATMVFVGRAHRGRRRAQAFRKWGGKRNNNGDTWLQ